MLHTSSSGLVTYLPLGRLLPFFQSLSWDSEQNRGRDQSCMALTLRQAPNHTSCIDGPRWMRHTGSRRTTRHGGVLFVATVQVSRALNQERADEAAPVPLALASQESADLTWLVTLRFMNMTEGHHLVEPDADDETMQTWLARSSDHSLRYMHRRS